MKKSINNTRYGLWMDSRHAKILKIQGDGTVSFKEMEASNQKRERFAGESTNKTGMLGSTLSPEKRMQARENNHLNKFIKAIVAELDHANAILILGSGDARFELQNAIHKSKTLNGVWIENRASSKLSRRELEMETEKHYNLSLQ
ncbi:MAG: hypothetical protein RLZZ45_639 [Bacteroidota bacterium]|jgi:hypothetical protein|nr:hypothetical protein [Chitinophagia bacterium]